MSTWQKAAVLLPVVLSSEDFQLHMVILTGKQAFREQEAISWKSCTASTLSSDQCISQLHWAYTPAGLWWIALLFGVLFMTCCAILWYTKLGRQTRLWSFAKAPFVYWDMPKLPATNTVTTHIINLQFRKSLSQTIRLSLAEQELQGFCLADFPPAVQNK